MRWPTRRRLFLLLLPLFHVARNAPRCVQRQVHFALHAEIACTTLSVSRASERMCAIVLIYIYRYMLNALNHTMDPPPTRTLFLMVRYHPQSASSAVSLFAAGWLFSTNQVTVEDAMRSILYLNCFIDPNLMMMLQPM